MKLRQPKPSDQFSFHADENSVSKLIEHQCDRNALESPNFVKKLVNWQNFIANIIQTYKSK
jgi:hypothetical protein